MKVIRDVDKALIYHFMFEAGIVPMDQANMDMGRPLKDVSPEEARVMKRKFRKVWRKLAKRVIADPKTSKHMKGYWEKALGMGKKVPTRAEKLTRKTLVWDTIYNEVIVPMLKEFDRPKRPELTAKKA